MSGAYSKNQEFCIKVLIIRIFGSQLRFIIDTLGAKNANTIFWFLY